MYEDKDLWPFKYPTCGKEFTEEIGRFKADGYIVHCPGPCEPGKSVRTTIPSSDEQFRLMLAEAKQGVADLWRGMLRISKRS